MDDITLTPEEVTGLRDDEALFQVIKSLDERDNGEAEARASLAAFTHMSVQELTDFAVDTVKQIEALNDRMDELTYRTALGMKLLAEGLDGLERPSRFRLLYSRVRARTRL